MAGVTDLLKNRRKALSDALRSGKYGYAGQEQARVDSAPAGSIGAPSGVMPARAVGAGGTGKDPLLDLMTGASFLPGLGDVAGLAADARMYATQPESRTPGNAALTLLGALPFIPSMTVFHGSPHKFDAFDMKKIGTGEGAQAYGHGLYFAESPDVAATYRNAAGWQPSAVARYEIDGQLIEAMTPDEKAILHAGQTGDFDALERRIAQANRESRSRYSSVSEPAKQHLELARRVKAANRIQAKQGALYEVDLPDEAIEKMLDWDAPLSEQPEAVKAGVRKAFADRGFEPWQIDAQFEKDITGEQAHAYLGGIRGQKDGGDALKKAGIPGIKYYDGMSRQGGKGTRNFVVFDDKLPKILKRE